MIVYSIFHEDDGGSSYFATKSEALDARDNYFGGGTIERLTLIDLPPRALAVKLLNGEGFVARREVVS